MSSISRSRSNSLRTGRLLLLPITNVDGDGLYHVHRDPIVSLLLIGEPRMKRAQSDRLLQQYVSHWERFGLGFYLVYDRNVSSGRPIGRCGLRLTQHQEVELGYCFTAAATGRGLATEAATAVIAHAFQSLGIDQIVAFVRRENVRSMRVLSKLSFKGTELVDPTGNLKRFVLNGPLTKDKQPDSSSSPWS